MTKWMTENKKKEKQAKIDFRVLMNAVAHELKCIVEYKDHMNSCKLMFDDVEGLPVWLRCYTYDAPIKDHKITVHLEVPRTDDNSYISLAPCRMDEKICEIRFSGGRKPQAIAKDILRRAVNNPFWIAKNQYGRDRVNSANRTLKDTNQFQARLKSEVPGVSCSANGSLYLHHVGHLSVSGTSVHISARTLKGDHAIAVLKLLSEG